MTCLKATVGGEGWLLHFVTLCCQDLGPASQKFLTFSLWSQDGLAAPSSVASCYSVGHFGKEQVPVRVLFSETGEHFQKPLAQLWLASQLSGLPHMPAQAKPVTGQGGAVTPVDLVWSVLAPAESVWLRKTGK